MLEAGRSGDRRSGSWRASTICESRIGTMNPPLTPPRRGTAVGRALGFSPPGRGQGWVGSWAGQGRVRSSEYREPSSRLALTTPWRVLHAEERRSPDRPVAVRCWKRADQESGAPVHGELPRFANRASGMNPPLTPPRRGTAVGRALVFSPPGRGQGWVGSWGSFDGFWPRIATMNRR